MKVIKKKTEDGHIRLDATASTADVTNALNKASEVFCAQVGIRPQKGKTPQQVVSEQLGIRDLDSAVAAQAAEMLVAPALNKHGIIPAFNPVPQTSDMMKRGKTFTFTLDVVPKPFFELKDYGPVTFTAEPFQSDEKAIDEQIGEMARTYSTFVATNEERPLGKSDTCKLKLEISKNGEIVEGLTTEGRTYTLGLDLMPVGFDENLVGMEIGETREFTFEGPGLDEDMNEIMETYDTKATLIELQKEVVPVIDDEWVKNNMPMYESLQAMREDYAKKNDEERMAYYDDYKRNLAARALAERFEGTIPDEIYEGAMREQQKNLRQQVAASGMSWDDFLKQQGGEDQVNMMTMVSMRQSLIQGYALDAYYRHHGLSYNEQDLDDACFQVNPRNPHAARLQMERNGLGFALREAAERLRACKHLLENADIKYGKPTVVG